MNKGKELKIISDEVVDFINTHQKRHDVSDEYKNTSVFENRKDENMTMYVFDKTKVNNSNLGYNSSLTINIDPTYDKTVKISDDDTTFKPSIYETTTRMRDEICNDIKKSSQELFRLGDYKFPTLEEKKQAIELTDKLYRRAVGSLAAEPVEKKKKRIKRPRKTFGKNKGVRK